jgi:hypothetical protein
VELIKESFPQKTVLAVSARHGGGFDELVSLLAQPAPAHQVFMDVDYDTYAEGEAELGWLNCHFQLRRPQGVASLDAVVYQLVSDLASRLEAEPAETAHLKVMGQHEAGVAIANLVASGDNVEISRESLVEVPTAQVILNARVATDPDRLEAIVRETIARVADAGKWDLVMEALSCFRPGRPVPTHRFGVSDA